ncbi:uncharacterized protein LOC129611999 [Condylostylus longicornis]|uniref:uncharacterized protein LOC129611999 n=1 Tax=Condylostylus longicornis TaxID=2530218 RepID=UPI00244DC6C6|nr:uncharacterized protein LOC129611999 [Condylostylus longicornis]
MSADNIKVAIKARPVLKKEKDSNVYWKISNNSIQLVESQAEPFYFDHIFDHCSSNEDIFNTVVKPIVNSCMEGINGTIFAYGQTSSGKTYTMLGDEENPGVINLAVKEIFNFIQKSLERLFLLRVGYIEIYNEKIYDLLNKDNKDLKIHETAGEVTVDCTEFIVTNEEDIWKHLQKGNKLRKCGETNMNERSSRSHAIFKLTVESREVQKSQVHETDTEAFQISSLNLVDLAGSERADQTGATGSRLIEGSHINKSLLSLGIVIKSLSENAESYSYINYRNSKLTRILQASLGGNALTAIICNIKLTTIDETNSTLNFAMRAKTVKNKPHVNEVISDAAMMRILEKKVAKLQCELDQERKKNSKLKILELEQQIKNETHKIVNSESLKKCQFDRNRRRTWCPSSADSDSTQNTQKSSQYESKRSLKCEPKLLASRIPNFQTPLITYRNDTNWNLTKNEDDDLFKESPIILNDNVNYCETPNFNRNSENLDSSPSESLQEKYEMLERKYKELETFTNLENKIGVDHELVNSLLSQLQACRLELSNKDEKIQNLMIAQLDLDTVIEKYKIETENKDAIITELRESLLQKERSIDLEIRDKVSIEFEFEQLKHKSKIREDELLDLIQEKDECLRKLEKNRNNIEIFQQKSYKINNNFCKLCGNCVEKLYNSKATIPSPKREENEIAFAINRSNHILEKMCNNLKSKYLKAEETFHEIELELQKTKIDLECKSLKLTELSVQNEQLVNLKCANQIEKKEHCLLQKKFQSLFEEKLDLEAKIIKNNEQINAMEQECSSLKIFISSLIDNIRKLEQEHEIVLQSICENMRMARIENKTVSEKLSILESILQEKNRKLNTCENIIQKFSLNIPFFKNQLIQIDSLLRNETAQTSEKFEILKKQMHNLFINERKIPLLENTLNNSEFSPIKQCKCAEKLDWGEICVLKNKVEFFEEQTKELQHKNDNMKLELSSLRNENENLSEKILDTVTSLDMLTFENNEMKISSEILSKQVSNLQNELNLKATETQGLKLLNDKVNLKIKEIQIQNENLLKQVDKFQLTEHTLNERNHVLQCSYEKIVLDNSNNKLEIDQLKCQLQNLKTMNENLVEKLNEAKVLNESLNTEIKLKSKEYQDVQESQQNLYTINKNVLLELEDLKNKYKFLNQQFDNKCDELGKIKAVLKADNNKAIKENNDLVSENEELILKLENILGSLEGIKNDNQIYLSEISHLKEQKEKLQNEVEEIKKQLHFYKVLAGTKEKETNSLNSEVDNLKHRIEEIKSKKEIELRGLVENNKKSLEKLNQEFEKEKNILENQIKNLQAHWKDIENERLLGKKDQIEIAEMETTIKTLQNEIINLKAKNDDISSEFSKTKNEYSKMQIELNEIIKFKEENEKLKKDILDTKSLLCQYEKEIQSNKIYLLAHSKSKEEYKRIIDNLKTEVTQLKLKNQTLCDEIEAKQQRHTESWRKLRRQSCHDETRSFFSEPFKEVSVMTDPTNEFCNCKEFADLISELKKTLLIRDSQIIALNLKLNNNMMIDEIQKLKKELLEKESEKKKLNDDISTLKDKIDQQSKKYSEHLRQVIIEEKIERKKLLQEQAKMYEVKLQNIVNEKENTLQYNTELKNKLRTQLNKNEKTMQEVIINKELEQEKLIKEIQQLKAEISKYERKVEMKKSCILQEKNVQTEEYKTNDVKHLQELNQDLRNICRHRQGKINALKEEIQNLKKRIVYSDIVIILIIYCTTMANADISEQESQVLFKENKAEINLTLPYQDEFKDRKSAGWTFWVTTVGILTTIGSAIPVGYTIGVINSPSNYIRDWCNQTFVERFDITLEDGSLDILLSVVVSIFLVGGAIGSLGGAWAADRFGRRGSYLICCKLFIVASFLFYYCRKANSFEMLLLGRLIAGLASGLCTTSLPMYLTEIAPLALRGALGTFCAIGVTGGVVVGQIVSLRYVLGTEEYWHYALSGYIYLVIIGVIFAYYFPESPKYLYLVKDRIDDARTQLYRLRKDNEEDVNFELEEMEVYKSQNVHKESMLSVLKNSKLLLPLIIVAAFMGGQQLSGINAIFYYSVTIFKRALQLSQTDAEWANLGAGCVNLFTSFLGPYLMKNYNRRSLMMFSCGIDAILLFAVGIIIYFINENSWLPIACVVAILLYIFFYQFGLGPIPYFIGSELFETESRPVAMAMGSLSSWVCNFIIGISFPSLQSAWGAFVFMPFSITCALLFLLTKYYLPETRGRNVSDVAKLVSNGFRSKIN